MKKRFMVAGLKFRLYGVSGFGLSLLASWFVGIRGPFNVQSTQVWLRAGKRLGACSAYLYFEGQV